MMYGPRILNVKKNLKLALVQKTINMSGYPVSTITALMAIPEERDWRAMHNACPERMRAGLMSHPCLIKGVITEGERGDYDLEVIAHQLGAKRMTEEELYHLAG